MRSFAFLIVASAVAFACGGESEDGGSSTGGASTGGSTTGGSGGSTTGGASGSGGSTTGGASGSGGSTTGGAAGTGGSTTGGTGGSATGGSGGTGGSTTGGSGGTGGSTTGGSGGAGGTGGSAVASPECKVDADCKVFEDCCSCEGVPKADTPPVCKMACTTKKCAALGVNSTDVACIAGRCVKGFECNSTAVVCLSMPPKCPAGEVAQVKGSCWSGECVPADECKNVATCSDCDTAKFACVTYVAKPAPQRHCVDVPPVCGGTASCACFGPSVCTGSFNSCNDLSGVKGVTCGCPTC